MQLKGPGTGEVTCAFDCDMLMLPQQTRLKGKGDENVITSYSLGKGKYSYLFVFLNPFKAPFLPSCSKKVIRASLFQSGRLR